MSAAGGGAWMVATAARYQVRNTTVVIANGVLGKLCNADPRRWYVRFAMTGGAGTVIGVMPGPVPGGITTLPSLPIPVECAFRDRPAACIGEWFAVGAAGLTFHVSEELYVGG